MTSLKKNICTPAAWEDGHKSLLLSYVCIHIYVLGQIACECECYEQKGDYKLERMTCTDFKTSWREVVIVT